MITSAIYALTPPSMEFVLYKLIICSAFTIFSLILAIRFRDRIVAQWLNILARYNLRPKYYIYNKNVTDQREIIAPEIVVAKKAVAAKRKTKLVKITPPSIKEVLQLDHVLDNSGFNLTYRVNKRGGLNVAFEKIA